MLAIENDKWRGDAPVFPLTTYDLLLTTFLW